jgi:hypothetical protein
VTVRIRSVLQEREAVLSPVPRRRPAIGEMALVQVCHRGRVILEGRFYSE